MNIFNIEIVAIHPNDEGSITQTTRGEIDGGCYIVNLNIKAVTTLAYVNAESIEELSKLGHGKSISKRRMIYTVERHASTEANVA